jgi:Arc/MetJ-type ribon-helix-helix transcriptional regulator
VTKKAPTSALLTSLSQKLANLHPDRRKKIEDGAQKMYEEYHEHEAVQELRDILDRAQASGISERSLTEVLEEARRRVAIVELQRLITEGIESGEPQAFDFDDFIRRMHEKAADTAQREAVLDELVEDAQKNDMGH